MIVDLSAPNGASINDGIGADVCSLKCFSGQCSVDHTAPGPGNTADYNGFEGCLPHHTSTPSRPSPLGYSVGQPGLCQQQPSIWVAVSTKGVNAFADLVAWAIHLDDFLLLGAPGTLEVASTAAVAMEVLGNAAVPVAAHKTEGPSTAVTSWVSWWTLSCFN